MLKKIIGILLILIGGYIGIVGLINGLAWIRGMGNMHLIIALIGLIGGIIAGLGVKLFKSTWLNIFY